MTFGRPGRYVVSVGRGLLLHGPEHSRTRRAVLLHELAHIRNGDVGVTQAALALFRVFVVTMVLPFLAQSVWFLVLAMRPDRPYSDVFFQAGPAPQLLSITLGVVTAFLVFLSRVDIMRTREFHADHRAVRWGADPDCWSAAERAPSHMSWRSVASRWSGTHPTWSARRRALDDPRGLFVLGSLSAFLVGAAAMLVVQGLSNHATANVVGVVACGALVAGGVGLPIWAATSRAVAVGEAPPSAIRPALFVALGLGVGSFLSDRPLQPTQWLPASPWPLVGMMVCAAGLIGWNAHCLRLAAVGWSRPRFRVAFVLTAGSGLFAFFFWWYEQAVDLLTPEFLALAERLGAEAGFVGSGGLATLIGGAMLTWTPVAAVIPFPATLLWAVPVLLVVIAQHRGERSDAPTVGRLVLTAVLWAEVSFVLLLAVTGLVAAQGWGISAYLVLMPLAGISGAVVITGRYAWRGQSAVAVGCAGGGLVALVLVAQVVVLATLVASASEAAGDITQLGRLMAQLLLGPLMFVVGTVALTACALAKVLTRRPAARPIVPESSPRPVALPATVLVCLMITVLSLLADVPAAPPRRVLPAETIAGQGIAPQTADPEVLRAQAVAWVRYGGLDITNEWTDIVHAIDQGSQVVGDTTQSERPLRDACARAGRLSQRARAYFRFPDAGGQLDWSRFIDATGQGALTCESGFAHHDSDEIAIGLRQFGEASEHFDSLCRWLVSSRTP